MAVQNISDAEEALKILTNSRTFGWMDREKERDVFMSGGGFSGGFTTITTVQNFTRTNISGVP